MSQEATLKWLWCIGYKAECTGTHSLDLLLYTLNRIRWIFKWFIHNELASFTFL